MLAGTLFTNGDFMALTRITLSGDKVIRQQLRRYGEVAVQGLRRGLYQEAEKIMTASKELVPVDTGTLRASGHVQLPVQRGVRVSVDLGYGGPAGRGNLGASNREPVGYAVIVHEKLNVHHTVGQAKYLEVPLQRAKPGMSRRIADHIRRATRGLR